MLYNTERPMTFDSVVGQKYIVESIRAQAIKGRYFGVYVFGGHFGCGKTSMSRILALAANCEHLDDKGNPCLECEHCKSILAGSPDIVELDAATNTGVDSIRELRETVSFKPAELKRKVYIIDEVHMLSKGAFNALLKVLEEPPEFVTFILCTTEINAIPATIRSRGACYFFEQLTVDALAQHVEDVAAKNGIVLLEGASNLIAKYSQGAARNSLSILDQVSSVNKEVSAQMVQELLGVSDNETLFHFAKALLDAQTEKAVVLVNEFESCGKDFSLLCDDLIEIITDAVLYTISGKQVIRNTEVYETRIKSLVAGVTADRLCVLADHLHTLKGELRSFPDKSIVLAAVIRLTMDTNNSIIALTARISSLEKELAEIKRNGLSVGSPVSQNLNFETVAECADVISDEPSSVCEDTVLAKESLLLDEMPESLDMQDNRIAIDVPDESPSVALPVMDDTFESVNAVEVPFELAENESVELPSLAESTESKEMDCDFDPFDFFDNFGETVVSDSMPTESNEETVVTPEESKEERTVSKEDLQQAFQLVNRMATEHTIFATALKGCSIKECNDGLHVVTDIEELKHVVRLYADLYERKGMETKYLIVQ